MFLIKKATHVKLYLANYVELQSCDHGRTENNSTVLSAPHLRKELSKTLSRFPHSRPFKVHRKPALTFAHGYPQGSMRSVDGDWRWAI